jgi:hypothetical protein
MIGIRHTAFNGGETSSWYAHLQQPTQGPWDGVFVQGDWVGSLGTSEAQDELGNAACHLHYQLNLGWGSPLNGAQSSYVHFSGTPGIDGSGVDTFSAGCDGTVCEGQHAFRSNNTGPGYCRPYAPAGVQPGGPDFAPCNTYIRDYIRNLAVYTIDVGSTKASSRGPCGANRRWVKTCGAPGFGTIWMQNYVAQGLFGDIPRAVVQSGPVAVTVDGHFWKAYGRRCSITGQGTRWVYEWLGQPATEDQPLVPGVTDVQYFQGGNIVKNYSNPSNVIMTMGLTGGGSCTFTGVLDINNDPCYDVNGDAAVNTGDQLFMSYYISLHDYDPGFDDRFDFNMDGVISAGDQLKQALQFGLQCK